MLDPETIVEKLKLVEQEMDVYRWYREARLGEAVRDAIELIERLRPKSMTTERAVELMNQIAYDGVDDWEEDEDELGYVRSRSLKQGVGTWTAAAIGRQIEHEKEAGIG